MLSDSEPPTVTCPDDMTFASSEAATFTTPSATDNDGSNPEVSCDDQEKQFVNGENTVECTASDQAGNEGSCTFKITIGKNNLTFTRSIIPLQR